MSREKKVYILAKDVNIERKSKPKKCLPEKCSSYNKIFLSVKISLHSSLQAEIQGEGLPPASFDCQKAQPFMGY